MNQKTYNFRELFGSLKEKSYFCNGFNRKGVSMATPIRPIPVVTGDDAVRFVEAAEAAERNAHTVELEMSREDFDKIMSTAQLY